MKLIVAGIYPPDTGGPATYAVALERFLPALGITVEPVPFRSVRSLPPVIRHFAYAWELWRALQSADALLAQDAVSSGLPAWLASMFARKPLLLRLGGDYAWEQGVQRFGVTDTIEAFQTTRYGWRIELLRRIQALVARKAKAVIAPSRYLAGIIGGWLPEGREAHVIYNGVELPAPAEAPSDTLPRPLIVSGGRLVPWKGFDGLIRAIAPEPSWHLALIGDGPDRERLGGIARAAGCADRVRFLGALPREQLLGWAAVADAFVLNSSYEGLSHTLLEVLSLGTPVIASAIPGNAEVIADGESGLLVPPGDDTAVHAAIARILSDPGLAARLATAGKERVHAFSVEETMRQVAGTIKDVCAS
ncbi:MAG TPA: glycosyltransferase family 4 protein [Candidatus Paceibacterota bacterium]|nr:glycosyltransferase family 4 protein [Candidatus Paceibacterota bacterium]